MADPTVSTNGDGTAAGSTNSQERVSEECIFLFYPNLIGYTRIILTATSLYYMPLDPLTCSLLYTASCLLDALDGIAARYFDQKTAFGEVLDMVTDRCTTACLLVFLASAFPRWSIAFQGLLSLDLSSHYVHMYASEKSHKEVDRSASWVLHLYYTNKTVLFGLCTLNEMFFIALYHLSFSSPTLLQTPNDAASLHVQTSTAVESSMLFTSPWSAGATEYARASKTDPTVPRFLARISFPFMVGKQIINVVQLVHASRSLAKRDLEKRKNIALKRQ
ncbi:CDP-alcohol phosphatidyltransferase-domain-containing protein [Clohesyomyces aquaticus]|uniref:CDP-diacylglycerol--inositol 3-phosphatidyltransferase n=1 Tax=Clohesyomyces aquaticus TaxID=1231657 RepID=A0A1Y1ZTY9_9PLEO|nr:CDP-alcohol phosphatidyltransferase-domain-containing protein [Clohesyomyces aquaticus]